MTYNSYDLDLIEQYKIMHNTRIYGDSSNELVPLILRVIEKGDLNPKRILDYGAGQSMFLELLQDHIKFEAVKYDPGIPQMSKKPEGKFDLVVCTDVLEHIREETLSDTLQEIKSYSDNAIFIIITKPSLQFLPNGENCHCTVKPFSWWLELLSTIFPTVDTKKTRRDYRLCATTFKLDS